MRTECHLSFAVIVKAKSLVIFLKYVHLVCYRQNFILSNKKESSEVATHIIFSDVSLLLRQFHQTSSLSTQRSSNEPFGYAGEEKSSKQERGDLSVT